MKGRCDIGLHSFIAKIKIGHENDGIFGWFFFIWIPAGTKHVLSADSLFVYERSSRSWRFCTVLKSTFTFPHVLGVNDGIEHVSMQHTIWSRFLPHRLRNLNISALFPAFLP
jgi:hypothetical protein